MCVSLKIEFYVTEKTLLHGGWLIQYMHQWYGAYAERMVRRPHWHRNMAYSVDPLLCKNAQ